MSSWSGKRGGLVLTACAIVAILVVSLVARKVIDLRSPRPASSAPVDDPNSITILGTGDVIAHPAVWEQARREATGVRTLVGGRLGVFNDGYVR